LVASDRMSREWWHSFLLMQTGRNGDLKAAAQRDVLCRAAAKPHPSHRGALHRVRRLAGVELPVALFDAASPLEAGNSGADMVRASSLACRGDFLLRPAIRQSKHLIAEGG
jgi:hypothetical protein